MSCTRAGRVAARGSILFVSLVLLSAAVANPRTGPVPPLLRIGVGGDYPDGLDGLLVSRGIVYERVFPWEMADPEVLKRYDVLLLSCPAATKGSLDKAVTDWMAAGGRAYVEVWPAIQTGFPLPGLVTILGNAGRNLDLLPTAGDHPITRGLDAKAPIDLFHLSGTLIRPTKPDGARVLARFCPDGGGSPLSQGDAVLCLPVGKGELVYSGAPLSFTYFHRGPTTEPMLWNIVDHLARGRAIPRFTTAVPTPAQAGAPAEPAAAPEEPPGKPPTGFEAVDEVGDGPYNVTARVRQADAGRDGESVLLLDGRFGSNGQATQPCLWLALRSDRIKVRAGKDARSRAIASARWQAPAGATDLLIRRRPGALTVVLADTEVLRAKTRIPPGGSVAAGSGGALLDEIRCQPVGDASFGDDFMREPGEASQWTAAGGEWKVVGVGHEEQSVNGFYYRGAGAETALAAAGEAWWDDYTASVAARLEPGGPPPGDAGTCGLAALRQANGDCLAFLAHSSRKPEALLRLVQLRGGAETVLAERKGGIDPGQWYRLAVRLREGKIEAFLDGERVLTARSPEPRGGGIGLLVRGGSARFDDVLVHPSSEPPASPRNEGTPAADLPASLGPQDSLTWANPASAWAPCPERPSLLWHEGHFPGDVRASLRLDAIQGPALRRLLLAPDVSAPEREWLAVTARVLADSRQASLTLIPPNGRPAEEHVDLAAGGTLSLERERGNVVVCWNGRTLFRAGGAKGLRSIGLEVEGPPVPLQGVEVRAPDVRDYVFGVAPTDWRVSSGTWEVASRWACDNRWSWFSGWGSGDFAVWNKRPVQGDVVLCYTMGVKMQAPGGGETQRCRDLNATLCGDGANPRSGYSLVLGGDGGEKTRLLRNGVVVAERPDIRVPAGYSIHHQWYQVRFARIGRRVEVDFEGRPLFRYEDRHPLRGGQVGLWSRDSGVLVPRVIVYP